MAHVTFHRTRAQRVAKEKLIEQKTLEDLMRTDPMAVCAYDNAKFADKVITECERDQERAGHNIARGLGVLVGSAAIYAAAKLTDTESLYWAAKACGGAGALLSTYSFVSGLVANSQSRGYMALRTFAMAQPEYKVAKDKVDAALEASKIVKP